MKRKMAKLLAAVMALVLAIGMTVGVNAFTGDYFETTECWDYVEEETVIGNSVEAVAGTSKTIMMMRQALIIIMFMLLKWIWMAIPLNSFLMHQAVLLKASLKLQFKASTMLWVGRLSL